MHLLFFFGSSALAYSVHYIMQHDSPTAVNNRLRTNVEAAKIAESLKRIPLTSIHRTGATIQYSKCHSTKVAPKWCEVKPYVPCLSALMDVSGGRNIKLTSMRAGILVFLDDNPKLKPQTVKEIDRTAYSLTTIISQMQNHKRGVPAAWKSTFFALIEKLSPEDDLQIVPITRPEVPSITLSDDSDCPFQHCGDLLASDDPNLHQLLNPDSSPRPIKGPAVLIDLLQDHEYIYK